MRNINEVDNITIMVQINSKMNHNYNITQD